MKKKQTNNLNRLNIDDKIEKYYSEIHDIGKTIANKAGVDLLMSLKRDKLNHGRYPNVTLFEAANRIMSDLVILHGVNGLLKSDFPFDNYEVEYGNENNNDFDIKAKNHNQKLAGEAFNVASSFFQGKKRTALKKLRSKAEDYDYKIIIFNSDAITQKYAPNDNDVYHIVVDILSRKVEIRKNNQMYSF